MSGISTATTDNFVQGLTFNTSDGVFSLTQGDTGSLVSPETVDLDGRYLTSADIVSLTNSVTTNTTNIAANTTNIATNTTNIATNVTDIATNTTNIATNTTNIATNTTNIATNVTDITAARSGVAANTAAIVLLNSSFHSTQVRTMTDITSITIGNPSDTNPNQFGGEVDLLTVSGISGNADKVCLDFMVVGEWSSDEFAKGLCIARYKLTGGSYAAETIIRGAVDGTSVRIITPFVISSHFANVDSTLESAAGRVVDSDTDAGETYRYRIVLLNSSGIGGDFRLNKTRNTGSTPGLEIGLSILTAQEFY